MSSTIEDKEFREFEERSDDIDNIDLESWNVENEHFAQIQQRLLSRGTKLLSGPRGTGKTHQMRIAHLICLKDDTKPLSVFVSFSKYYHLEPFLTKVPDAIQIFHTWVLCKIVIGCISTVEELESKYNFFDQNDPYLNKDYIYSFVEKAEKLNETQLNDDPLIAKLTIPRVSLLLDKLINEFCRNRLVLMLDDAALSLTPDYLVEFFDVVRSLKSNKVSPKASVYPGTTQYGPRFHVGHDAELVHCWLNIETSTYSLFMNSLIEKRFQRYSDGVNQDIIEISKASELGYTLYLS